MATGLAELPGLRPTHGQEVEQGGTVEEALAPEGPDVNEPWLFTQDQVGRGPGTVFWEF